MSDSWFLPVVEAGENRVVNSLFAFAGPAVLPFVLLPVLDQESLDVDRRIFKIIEQCPAIATVPLANMHSAEAANALRAALTVRFLASRLLCLMAEDAFALIRGRCGGCVLRHRKAPGKPSGRYGFSAVTSTTWCETCFFPPSSHCVPTSEKPKLR